MIKLFWGSKEKGIGNSYGYSIHNETLYKYTKLAGKIDIVDDWKDADCGIYITTPEIVGILPPIPTFLFTMFEGLDVPDEYLENIKKADYIITPSTWVKGIFSKYFDSNKIFVVPHGVEPIFTYKKREYHFGDKFRYLWVGAANPRKGWQEIAITWEQLKLHTHTNKELYIKTTAIKNEYEKHGNVILDGRNISQEELINLYHSSHCFLFPTRGEGWGLTLGEAMATGLPCISTNYSGITDFFNRDVGYPIGYNINIGEFDSPMFGKKPIRVAYPDMSEMAKAMIYVFENYKKALEKGWRASYHIKKNFTWEQSAEKLYKVLDSCMRRN